MTKIIGLVQVKGGAERSTVSTNLAGELSKSGNKSDCTETDIIAKLLARGQMKIVVLLFTALLFCFSSLAQNVTVLNTFSCGRYVESRVRSDAVPSVWILGFLSGANVFNQRKIDILQTIDRESILLWMDKRCKDNPLEYVEDGAALLMQELAQKALERTKK